MIPLENKVNTVPPGGAWPFGDVIDNNGTGNGTPVNRALLGDSMQFFESLMFFAGQWAQANGITFTPNNQPDNGSSSTQLITALEYFIFLMAANQATVNAGTDNRRPVTAVTLAGFISSGWVVPGTAPAVVGYTDANVALTTILDTYKFFKYKTLGKNIIYSVSFSVTCSGSGNWTSVRIPLPSGVTCKGDTFSSATVVGADGTVYPAIIQAPDAQGYIKIIPATNISFNKSFNLISTAQITFEIN